MTKRGVYYLFFDLIFCFAFLLSLPSCSLQNNTKAVNELSVKFTGDAQIEIGGPFVGIEMHHGSPLLNRISFFYPRANSIDLSTDYWQRDQSRILALGLKIGTNPLEWLTQQPLEFQLTPYSVIFNRSDEEKNIKITYQFCKDKPALVASFELTNNSNNEQEFEFYTHLEASLRTSHTYTLKDLAQTEFHETGSTVYVNYNDDETADAQLFIANAGELPIRYKTTAALEEKQNGWPALNNPSVLGQITNRENRQRPVAAFVYRKKLAPQEHMKIVQIIGSGKTGEGPEMVAYLLKNHAVETKSFESYVLDKAQNESKIVSNDTALDHSVQWAKAILATNAHFLDDDTVPMPCPAEYNFYFTHDVLVTDLGAVLFDTVRVKNDLQWLINHTSPDSLIPHAYYWKDHRFATEFAGTNNWNHFWFILVSASYLRHSNDFSTLEQLYPFLTKSIEQVRRNIKNGLSWADYPDWWDIGKNNGPRAYMTILAIRALREYNYVSTALSKIKTELDKIENLAEEMQNNLSSQLWDDRQKFLINFNENNVKDTHYFAGSLLAAHFKLLSSEKMSTLLQSAQENLLNDHIGIYNVYPMDFHLLKEYYRFHGNEAGDQYLYINGGVWPQGNAWYALGLIAADKNDEAFQFIKKNMSLQGIMKSPNGQPAMYEYRNSNWTDSTVYGKIDKPQFLWAAGWYLYSVYHLLGVRENEWNIAFDPYIIPGPNKSQFELTAGGQLLKVNVTGSGEFLRKIMYDGQNFPSAVIPEKLESGKEITLELGNPEIPYLASATAILQSCFYDSNSDQLNCTFKAFSGHKNEIVIASPARPKAIFLNGEEYQQSQNIHFKNGICILKLLLSHRSKTAKLLIQF